MKDYETERARQERDSVAAGALAAVGGVVAVLFMLALALPFGGRVVVVLAIAVVAVVAVARHVRDND